MERTDPGNQKRKQRGREVSYGPVRGGSLLKTGF